MKNTFLHMKLGIFSCLLAGLAPLAAAQDAAAPQDLMREMAGVYKHRFTNGIVVPGKDDETYQAEDVVEIVPFDNEHIYVRARLNFYNGHTCAIAAMARHEDGAFVYREREALAPGLPACVMKVGVVKGQLTITDREPGSGRTCEQHCGARGTMNYTIGMDKRRPIRYMERLKASRQYKAAVAEMQATGRQAGG